MISSGSLCAVFTSHSLSGKVCDGPSGVSVDRGGADRNTERERGVCDCGPEDTESIVGQSCQSDAGEGLY